MKAAVIAEAVQVKLERLRLDQEAPRDIVDHEMSEIGLTGYRTQASEFRRGEARHVIGAGLRIGHAVESCPVRRGRDGRGAPQLQWSFFHRLLMHCLAAR